MISDGEKVVCYNGLKTFYENLKNEFVLKGQAPATNYEELNNKPKINGVELTGNKTLDELGIQPKIAEVNDEGIIIPENVITPSVTAEKIKAENLYDNTQVDEMMSKKLNVMQGVENAGKALVVGDDGNLIPTEVNRVGGINSISDVEIDEIMEGD